MEPTIDTSEFTSDDLANWRAFLTTRTGQRLVSKLVEGAPSLLAGGGINEILIRSGEVRGFSSAVQNLVALSIPIPEPKKEPPPYADLEDDTKWEGEKINP